MDNSFKNILILITLLVLPAIGAAASIAVFSDGVVYNAESYKIGEDEYISAEALAKVFRGRLQWNDKLHKGKLTFSGHSVVLIPDNPFVLVDKGFLSIPVTPQLHGGKLMISVLTVPAIFSKASGKKVVWDPEARTLLIGRGAPNIKGIRFSSSPSETKVVLDLTEPLKYRPRSLPKNKFEVFLEGGVLNSSDISAKSCPGLLRSVDAETTDDGARVVFHLNKRHVKTKVFLLKGPNRLLVTFTPGRKEVVVEKRALEVIVVDPGHGGRDPGAVGRTGLCEKTVTLDIGKRVAELLRRKLHVKVILTRTKDEFVSLAERAKIANENKADLFVSIHCNASLKRESGGTETYFLSVAKTDWARAVEARENAVIKFELPEAAGDTASLDYILWDMAQNEFLNESSEFAELVQKELTSRFTIEDRGLNQAGFYVLKGCYMPAILVELAFISNRKEEKLLKKDSFRGKAAQGIYEGIKSFKKAYERKLNL